MPKLDSATSGNRRLWLVGPLSPDAPDGIVDLGDGLAEILQRLAPGVELKLDASAVGPLEARVEVRALTDLRIARVIESCGRLKELRELADALGASNADARPTPEQALTRAGELLSEGSPLLTSLRETLAASDAADSDTSSADAEKGSSGEAGGDIFSQAELPKDSARSAVDRFVRQMRPARGKGNVRSSQRAARQLIEQAVFDAARQLLASPELSALEQTLRGIRMVVDAAQGPTGPALGLLHANGVDEALERLDVALEGDAVDQPVALLYFGPVSSLQELEKWSEAAEGWLIPAVVEAPLQALGLPALADLRDANDELASPDADCQALRAAEASRWVALAANRVVAFSEGAASARREVFTSPVLALGAMLAGSLRRLGTCANIVGEHGALQAPGSHELDIGSGRVVAVPTEYFVPLRLQAKLAGLGIIALGSGRNTTKVQLGAAPTWHGGEHPLPLSAQALTGQVVRLASWLRDQIPAGTSAPEIEAMFAEAGGLWLFPQGEQAGQLRAKVQPGEDGNALVVHASAHPQLAGAPLSFEFQLSAP